jgi:hypothetical protein
MITSEGFTRASFCDEDRPIGTLCCLLADHLKDEHSVLCVKLIHMAINWPRTPVHLVALRPEFPDNPDFAFDRNYNLLNNGEFKGGFFRTVTMEV